MVEINNMEITFIHMKKSNEGITTSFGIELAFLESIKENPYEYR